MELIKKCPNVREIECKTDGRKIMKYQIKERRRQFKEEIDLVIRFCLTKIYFAVQKGMTQTKFDYIPRTHVSFELVIPIILRKFETFDVVYYESYNNGAWIFEFDWSTVSRDLLSEMIARPQDYLLSDSDSSDSSSDESEDFNEPERDDFDSSVRRRQIRECSICFEQDRRMVRLKPCNHTGMCVFCIAMVDICPICRAPIESVED